ncbi:MAG TPA: hypothetical protein DCG75_17810 [Bacteroidales bacterium]|jgi:hypothetical protein|nr:hypothetical protein [Bacteroidales bacterium]
MERKDFIRLGLIGTFGLQVIPVIGSKRSKSFEENVSLQTIKEFVVAGHSNLSKVKVMLKSLPNLIYCRHDWGGGDFEEAIEGAGHVGNKKIAEYLINEGARVNLFVLAMLGKTEIVKTTLEQFPNLLHAKGAHGFTLLHHAKAGGKESEEIYNYLIEKGLTESKYNI